MKGTLIILRDDRKLYGIEHCTIFKGNLYLLAGAVKQNDRGIYFDKAVDIKDLTLQIVEMQMERGVFIIVESVSKISDRKYLELAKKHHYKVYRQDSHGFKRLDKKEDCDLHTVLHGAVYDLNKYKRVKVIGDVHGDYDSLVKIIDDDDETCYVFCGDLLDKGNQNKECLDLFLDVMNKPNYIFVEGNHDTHLRNWLTSNWKVKDGKEVIPSGFKKTLAQITEGADLDKLKKDLTKFTSKMRNYYQFTFDGKRYLVNHGGIANIPIAGIETIPWRQFTLGVGEYDFNVDEAYERSYEKNLVHGFTQIHGHRPTGGTKHSICLEDGTDEVNFITIEKSHKKKA